MDATIQNDSLVMEQFNDSLQSEQSNDPLPMEQLNDILDNIFKQRDFEDIDSEIVHLQHFKFDELKMSKKELIVFIKARLNDHLCKMKIQCDIDSYNYESKSLFVKYGHEMQEIQEKYNVKSGDPLPLLLQETVKSLDKFKYKMENSYRYYQIWMSQGGRLLMKTIRMVKKIKV